MMGNNGISGVWRSFKKAFSLKMCRSKVMHHLHTTTASMALLCIYVEGRFSVCCDIFTKAK